MGSEEARARAPLSMQRYFGPHDTWVRSYWAGEQLGGDVVRKNVRKAAALADVIGLLERDR
jgi:hypothetical protein